MKLTIAEHDEDSRKVWSKYPRFAGCSPAFRYQCCCLRFGTSIANVALPTLAQVFAASFQEVQWIVLAYLLAITTLISVGRFGDIIGRRRLLLAGIFLFTIASFLCGVAPTLWILDNGPGDARSSCSHHDGTHYFVCR